MAATSDLPGVPGFAFGLALDTDFATNGYLYMAYMQPNLQHGRIDRLTISPANQQLESTTILGTVDGPCAQGPPDNTSDCIPIKDPAVHSLGTLISDPRDGTLWVGNGDNALPGSDDPHALDAQDVNGLSGKVLHVDREGNGLPGHPFCPADDDLTHNCTKVYARGLRNPYRFRLRPSDFVPIAGDVGLESREEVDVIRPGRNYGWPCYEGDIRTPSAHQEHPLCEALYADPVAQGYAAPVYAYDHPTGFSITGGPVYAPQGGPADFPAEYHGDYFFADYVTGFIRRLRITPADALAEPPLPFATDQKDIVSLEQAPDGSLMVVEGKFDGSGGAIYKIKYTGSSDRAPTAQISTDRVAGPAPLTVEFDGRGSTDPESQPLTYSWDFGDGSAPSSSPNPTYTYDTPGNYTARLTVTDPAGNSGEATVLITPGNDAPVVDIQAPASFRGGDEIAMSATATDAQDGDLSASLVWNVVLFHRDHDHPEGSASLGPTRSFTATRNHEEDSRYRVSVRASDSEGVTTSKTVDIDPQLINLRLASEPPGVPMTIGGLERTTPFDRPSTINFIATVTAPEHHVAGSLTYSFERWSDGGARSHDISIPAADTTLTAVYRQTGGPQEPSSRDVAGRSPFVVDLPRGGLRMDAKGRVAFTLSCRRAAGRCRVKVALVTPPRRGRRPRRLARAKTASVPASRRATVRVKLSAPARKALRRQRRLAAQLRVTGHGERILRSLTVRARARRR